MGEAGYRRAKELFDGERNARETFNLFYQVLAENSTEVDAGVKTHRNALKQVI